MKKGGVSAVHAFAACVLFACSAHAAGMRPLAYGPHAQATGDLLLPEGVRAETPVVLVIHGGGWTAMDKKDVTGIAEFFRDTLGFVAYNVNYRLASPKHPWPACGDDCVAAARFVFSEAFAQASGTRPQRIWICGGSAGGHLALWTALNLPADKVAGAISLSGIADPGPDFAAHPGRFRALFGGAEPTAERRASADPVRLIRAGGPRLLLTHATGDRVVPIASAGNFAAAWRAAGNAVTFLEYPCDLEPGLTGHCIWRPDSKPHRLIAFLENALAAFVRGAEGEAVRTAARAMPAAGICAHRGDRACHPENTVPAFRAAVEKGAAMVEFDVHRCKTGELIVMHDETIDRTTTGTGRWRDATFAYLRGVDAGVKRGTKHAGVKIPTFDEAIDCFPKYGVWLNVHCEDDVTDEVARKIREKGRLHQAFIATGAAGIARARAAVPEIRVCSFASPSNSWGHAWTPAERRAALAQVVADRCEFYQPHYADFTPEELHAYHAAGGKMNFFWCNKPARLPALLARGIDFPLTDNLAPMVAAFRALREAPLVPADPERGFDYIPDANVPVGYLAKPSRFQARAKRAFAGIPSIAVSPKNGRQWLTFYAGPTDGEDSNNYVILATRRGKGAWEEVLVFDPDGDGPRRAFDPEVWVTPEGRLLWTWTERRVALRDGAEHRWGHPYEARSERIMGVELNAEEKPVAPHPAPRKLVDGGVMMCKPIVAKDGRWLLPVSFWGDDFSARIYASTDRGKTFAVVGAATLPARHRQFDEHNVVELKDGRLRVYMRACRNGAWNAWQADSRDGGRTWDAAKPCPFPQTNSRFFVRRVRSGALLLVKNGTLEPRKDAKDYTGRVDMTAYVSDDEGETWTGGLLLHAGDCAYPDGDEAPDGTIHVVFDGDRYVKQELFDVAFTEADVRRGGCLKR